MTAERKCSHVTDKRTFCKGPWNIWLKKCGAYDFGRECRDSSDDPMYKITTEDELCETDSDCRAGYRAWLDQCEAELGGGSDEDLASPEAPVADDAGTTTQIRVDITVNIDLDEVAAEDDPKTVEETVLLG